MIVSGLRNFHRFTSVYRYIIPYRVSTESAPRYLLGEVLFIAICLIAVDAAGDWVVVERFGKVKTRWFRIYLPLKHAVVNHFLTEGLMKSA